jgi:hypothetical protein
LKFVTFKRTRIRIRTVNPEDYQRMETSDRSSHPEASEIHVSKKRWDGLDRCISLPAVRHDGSSDAAMLAHPTRKPIGTQLGAQCCVAWFCFVHSHNGEAAPQPGPN